MSIYRITSRFPRSIWAQCRNSLLVPARQPHQGLQIPSNQLNSPSESQSKVFTGQVSLTHQSAVYTSAFQRFGFSTSASPETAEKENTQPGSEQGSKAENNKTAAKTAEGTEVPNQTVSSESGQTKAEEVPDSEEELSMEDLVKLVAEKEELLKVKHKEMEKMQDKVLRTYAEMENVMGRTRREAENSKKFAIQNFAKSLLDVADNLARASSVVKESFAKIDASQDNAGAVPVLKTLLEGVEMTEKQLTEVFKKVGVEKYEPTNEQFDPNRHNAVFQVPDASKPPGTVAIVLKAGYMLHDRVLRPAEVGVTDAADTNGTDKGSEA
ncbi:hypothetical protein NMG60_11037318 [Bertholletia excelsa]